MKSIAAAIYETIHKSKLSIDELADEIGCSPSLLYKISNINEPVELKLSRLIPLMRATKNYSILKHLAHRSGFILVKVPRARKMQQDDLAQCSLVMAEFQAALARYVKGEIAADEVHGAVDQALTTVASAKKMIEADTPQGDLFDEDHDDAR